MFRELLSYLGYRIKEFVSSRLFPLGVAFIAMFAILVLHLYDLQIVNGEEAQTTYIEQKTLRTISLPSTRGNIYDRNGTLLASNDLVFSVTIRDTGEYNGYQKNLIILKLLEILDRHGEKIATSLPLVIDKYGALQYTGTESTIHGILRDVYGKKSYQEVIDSDKCDENLSAQGLFELLYDRYGIGKNGKAASAGTYEISDADALRVMNVRYNLASHAYQRYHSVVVVENVGEEAMTEVLERSDIIPGVDIEETYQRIYTDSIYFAHIIGYTGTASAEDLDRLNGDEGTRFTTGDVVGKTGIEASMEEELQGIKGSRTMYLDSMGSVLDVKEETDPVTGNDIYLTIDHDLQIGIYHLIEQNLAGILIDKMENSKVYNPAGTSASKRKLSIYEAYYQMINNNILDMEHFASADAGEIEQKIYAEFLKGQENAYEIIREQLLSSDPIAYRDLGIEEYADTDENFLKIYFSYIYDVLIDSGYLLKQAVDTTDETYIAYKTDETISLSEFLRYAISKNWIDVSKLQLSGKFTSSEDTYLALVDRIELLLKDSAVFSKKIYKDLIYNQKISGCDICLALFEQQILEYDAEAVASLERQTSIAAYEFIVEKIRNLEITPAQLAMDPCSAAATVVDVNTGDVLACVSYPSYDNNRLSGSVDTEYYLSLVNDLSSPLYNTATQAQKAPGSVFKLVTTAAALESGVVEAGDVMQPEGIFTKQGLRLSCSYYSNYGHPHDAMNIVGAIAQSCNYFFCEMGYRLSLLDDTVEETYSEQRGINTINEYAEKLGLGQKTGIQLAELSPQISDTAPIPSAIGQGTNLFSNVQLVRYLATLANGGTIYNLTLLDKLTDKDGNLLEDYSPSVAGTAELSENTWNTIHEGMRAVATDNSGTRKNITCKVKIAGKTGTAEENKLRPNHANFICYAPYDAPEVGVGVTIPYGYTASNSVKIASDVLDFYYGELSLQDIQKNGASKASDTIIID